MTDKDAGFEGILKSWPLLGMVFYRPFQVNFINFFNDILTSLSYGKTLKEMRF